MLSNSPKMLGVLLCYNDGDLLGDAIEHLLNNNHDLVVWDHGSDDCTPRVLDNYNGNLVERRFIPRSFDFYRLYQAMSKNLIERYIGRYDWISWPDQDELLEGPRRDRSLFDYLLEAADSPYDWVQFHNFNYWLTDQDDPSAVSPVERIRHYSLFPDCAPRIRSWRAKVTNIRAFNHNSLPGARYPSLFNLRHYPARTVDQMDKRIFVDRAKLFRNGMNYHYDNLRLNIAKTRLKADQLHYDDGVSELNSSVIYNWRTIYGYGPARPAPDSCGTVLSSTTT
ncbi:MAG: glycosyltransferase family 2 protein [Chitinispirillaceae bacterium]|nr:glycosyltransferase family 2 protein [Chitinispirillaceae bacterium]